MKKALILVHSYYMLLTAIQMRVSVLTDYEVDVIISDASSGSEEVYKCLKNTEIFNNTYFLRQREIYNKKLGTVKKAIQSISVISRPEKYLKKAGLNILRYDYDVFYCYVKDKYIEQVVYSAIKKCNQDAYCELYEEGYISYFFENGIFETNNSIFHRILKQWIILSKGKKTLISNNIKKSWFFEPSLVQYDTKYPIGRIPKYDLSDKRLIDKINYIFNFEPRSVKFEDYAYIYLEDCAFTDGWGTDDLELIKIISEDLPDKSALMVKLHPRTTYNRFKALGIHTNNINFPFEVLALNSLMKGKTLITIGSGAPISVTINFGCDNKVLLLLKLTKYPVASMNNRAFAQYLDDIKKQGHSNILIPNDLEELRKIIIQEIKCE